MCQSCSLMLSASVVFPNYTISPGWLPANIIVQEIHIDLEHIKHINRGAFADIAFHSLTDIIFINSNLTSYNTDSFIRRNSITKIYIILKNPIKIPYNLFSCIESFIVSFEIHGRENVLNENHQLTDVANIVRKSPVQVLYVDNLNLYNTFTADVLLRFDYLQGLYLIDSKIISIAANAFYPVRHTLKQLMLHGNFLKTLPTGIFSFLLPNNNDLNIILTSNLWHCGCELSELKEYLTIYYNNFYSENVYCHTPSKFHGLKVINVDVCALVTEPIPLEPEIIVKCLNSSKSVALLMPTTHLQIKAYLNSIQIENSPSDEIQLLVWFDFQSLLTVNGTTREIHKCIINNHSTIHSMSSLTENSAFTFCLMNTSTISPLNCISYWMQRQRKPFTITNKKFRIISTIVGVVFISLSVGLILGCLALVIKPQLCGKKDSPNENQIGTTAIRNTRARLASGVDGNKDNACNNLLLNLLIFF